MLKYPPEELPPFIPAFGNIPAAFFKRKIVVIPVKFNHLKVEESYFIVHRTVLRRPVVGMRKRSVCCGEHLQHTLVYQTETLSKKGHSHAPYQAGNY